MLHQADFGISAQWHFSATSHGKGACDSLGGIVKRLAARASLQRPTEDQILTLFQLYEWASQTIPSITFAYCTTEEYQREKAHLEIRFQNSRTIPGRYSLSSMSKDERVTKHEMEIEMEQVSGYMSPVCTTTHGGWLVYWRKIMIMLRSS